MTSKSELKRLCVVSPLDMADKLARLESESEKLQAQVLQYQARDNQGELAQWAKQGIPDGANHLKKLERRVRLNFLEDTWVTLKKE